MTSTGPIPVAVTKYDVRDELMRSVHEHA